MGCGPDVFRLFDLADALVRDNQWRRYAAYRPIGRPQPTGPSLQEQLYDMYGRGELNEETFNDLKDLASRGQLRPVDLAVLRYQGRQKTKVRPPETEEETAIRQLQARIFHLESAREESARVLASLHKKIDDVKGRAQKREEIARRVIATDEARARRYLTEKQELLEIRARLEKQTQALQDDLAKLDELKGELEAKVTELEALHSRRELHALRTEIKEAELR
jgi:chromosome segregation ATPase